MTLDRRAALAALMPASLAVGTALMGGRALADEELTETNRTWLKLVCDLGGRTTFAVERGDVWGFKPQADDLTAADFAKRLYGYWSLVARKAAPQAGGGVSLKTKAWTFYLDPLNDAPVTEIRNPYTGLMVQCPPLSGPAFTKVYAPPASPSPTPIDPNLRQRRLGAHAWVAFDHVARFKPKDAAWFKLEADLVSYACRASDLDDRRAPSTPSTWAHNVVAEWQTWMGMHGTPGHILFKGDGGFIPDLGAAPAPLQSAIEAQFPGTLDAVTAWG